MTKREMFNAILSVEAVAANEEMVNFINHEIELLDKKKASSKKPTKTQLENEGFKAEIVAFLTETDGMRNIKEIQAEIDNPKIAAMSNQRITHLLTALRKEEKVIREYIKKVPYFSIARQYNKRVRI